MAIVMRPDRVYRSGVLSPMVGYQPQVDVQAVAQQFTQGPPLGMMLSGPSPIGILARWKLRLQTIVAERKAKKFMAVVAAPTTSNQPTDSGAPGPMPMMAQQVAPQMAAQMQMLAQMSGDQRGAVEYASQAISRGRYYTYFMAR